MNTPPEYLPQPQTNMDDDAWLKRQVQIGLDAANAGQLMSSEKVEALFAVKRATTRSQLNKITCWSMTCMVIPCVFYV